MLRVLLACSSQARVDGAAVRATLAEWTKLLAAAQVC
jgi:hypothetical protein